MSGYPRVPDGWKVDGPGSGRLFPTAVTCLQYGERARWSPLARRKAPTSPVGASLRREHVLWAPGQAWWWAGVLFAGRLDPLPCRAGSGLPVHHRRTAAVRAHGRHPGCDPAARRRSLPETVSDRLVEPPRAADRHPVLPRPQDSRGAHALDSASYDRFVWRPKHWDRDVPRSFVALAFLVGAELLSERAVAPRADERKGHRDGE